MVTRLSESILDKLSMDFLKNQVLKNSYGNNDTVIAKRDPRVLLIWYLFFGIVPWFVHDVRFLFMMFMFVTVTTLLARVAPLVLTLFCIGVFTQSGYLLLISLFFGGDLQTILALLTMSLKVVTVSLASITVFSGLDPDKLSNGLMWFGCPDQFSFSISFGYRILPMLMEQFQSILLSHKLRGKSPEGDGLIGKIKLLIYQIRLIILCFYPLMLNMAKRSRTTVEALELKGYRYSVSSKKVKQMKLSSLQLTHGDFIFSVISVVWVCLSILVCINF